MTGKVRFRKQIQTRHTARTRKLVPLRRPDDVQLDIGNDSILADFAQDDLPSDLGSGWAGNIIGWKHDLGDSMQANLWMMAVTDSDSAYEDAADDYRIRLDFNLKF